MLERYNFNLTVCYTLMKLGNTKKSVILIKMMFIPLSEHLITVFVKNREEYILKEQGTFSRFPSNLLNEKPQFVEEDKW